MSLEVGDRVLMLDPVKMSGKVRCGSAVADAGRCSPAIIGSLGFVPGKGTIVSATFDHLPGKLHKDYITAILRKL